MPISKYIPQPQEIGFPWYVNVADPAPGVNSIYLTLPDVEDYASYYIHSIRCKVATDANVANRACGIRLFYHTGAPRTIWEIFHTDIQTASTTFTYVFYCGSTPYKMEGNGVKIGAVPVLAINGALRVSVKVNFFQATDQLSDIWFHLSLFYPQGRKVNFTLP